MRVAALYDIHGNLPALGAVLRDVRDMIFVRKMPSPYAYSYGSADAGAM